MHDRPHFCCGPRLPAWGLGAEGQKCLFCPTVALYSRDWVSKMACFGARRGVFPGSGTQNGIFWGTEGCISRVGNPKWHVLGHGWQTEKAEAAGQRSSRATEQQGNGAAEHRRRSIRDLVAPAQALRGALFKALLAPGRCPEPAERWQKLHATSCRTTLHSWHHALMAGCLASRSSRAILTKMRALEHVIRQFGSICA